MTQQTTPRSLAWVSFLFPVALISLDQLSKLVMRMFFPESVVCNAAGPWGISLAPSFLIIFSLVILMCLAIGQWRQKLVERGFVWLFAGGISNLIDRIFLGCVTDFIHIFSFPVFNLADIYLTLGVVFLVLFLWSGERNK